MKEDKGVRLTMPRNRDAVTQTRRSLLQHFVVVVVAVDFVQFVVVTRPAAAALKRSVRFL